MLDFDIEKSLLCFFFWYLIVFKECLSTCCLRYLTSLNSNGIKRIIFLFLVIFIRRFLFLIKNEFLILDFFTLILFGWNLFIALIKILTYTIILIIKFRFPCITWETSLRYFWNFSNLNRLIYLIGCLMLMFVNFIFLTY